jgi:hypothetical protein
MVTRRAERAGELEEYKIARRRVPMTIILVTPP